MIQPRKNAPRKSHYSLRTSDFAPRTSYNTTFNQSPHTSPPQTCGSESIESVVASGGGQGQADAVSFRDKILTFERLPAWRERLRAGGKRLVVTNGCFDILHVGHITYLDAARQQGDALLVGLNSDASVRGIKGAGRPVNSEQDRATVLAALEAVDAVCVFSEPDAQRLLTAAQPDIYAKGGDYTIDTINQAERRLVEGLGGRVVVLGGVSGYSTTAVLRKLGAGAGRNS